MIEFENYCSHHLPPSGYSSSGRRRVSCGIDWLAPIFNSPPARGGVPRRGEVVGEINIFITNILR